MPIPEKLKPYAAQLGYPNSETLGTIFTSLFDSTEKLKIAAALPGTITDLAEKTSFPLDLVQSLIDELHEKGAINEKMDQQGTYRLYPGMIELRDAVVVASDVTSKMILLWDHVVRNELPKIVPQLNAMGIPPMMRVIPIEETIEPKSTVLDADSARNILAHADQIVAVPCVCRKTAAEVPGRDENCPAPDDLNLCLMINNFANESIARDIGELLSSEEAIRRLDIAEEAGLVHLTRNNIKKDMIICNCCACCCTGLFMLNQIGYDSFAPSRFRVKLDEDECTGCETCAERCQFFAIEVDEIARINLDKCYGCGVCVQTCPSEALTLEEIRPLEHIRVT